MLTIMSPASTPALNLKAEGVAKMRVALLPGCAQKVLEPRINAAAARLLVRHGVDVIEPNGVGCCNRIRRWLH